MGENRRWFLVGADHVDRAVQRALVDTLTTLGEHDEFFEQGGRNWDSSNFANQNQIESGLLHEVSKGHERTFVDELSGDSGVSAAGLDDSVVALFEEQNQQYALTSV